MRGGLVLSRHECETCGDDHFGIRCAACGWFGFGEYYPGGEPFLCWNCCADVTPTEEQRRRWERYEFDEDKEAT